MNIYQLAQKFRADLLRREARAQSRMLSAYQAVWQGLAQEIEALAERIQEGEHTPAHILFAEQRLRKLQDQLASAILGLAADAAGDVAAEQATVIALAQQHAGALFDLAAQKIKAGVSATFARLPKDALTHLVGVAQDGSPLAEVFQEVAQGLSLSNKDVVRDGLLQGLAMGWHPRKIAAHVKQQVDANSDNPQTDPAIVRRLNLVARQETLRVHREATRISYERNKKYIPQWQWSSSRDARVCPVCWAMDGKIFPVDEPFVSHVSCRCVQLPVIQGAEIDNDTGPAAFAKLEKGYQKQILGAGAFAAYERGDIEIGDLVGRKTHERWGDSLYRRSLADASAERRKLRSLAGAGGDWEVFDEAHDDSVVQQADPLACVSATGEMLLRARGVTHLTQTEIAQKVGVPSDVVALKRYFSSLMPNARWIAGGFDVKSAEAVLHQRNWGAVLREGSAIGHLVMVEGRDADGLFRIKDPFHQTSYRMTREELLKHLGEIIVGFP